MSHYTTLGVSKSATQDEIKKAFRVLAGKHHPDKGGDTEKFKEVSTAYDVLKDQSTRAQYDQQLNFNSGPFKNSGRQTWTGPGSFHFGFDMDDGMNAGGFQDGSFPEDVADLFREMHRSGRPPPNMHTQQRDKRNRDIRLKMSVPLESLLEAQSKTINVNTPDGEGDALYVTIPTAARDGTRIKYPGLGDNMFKSLPRGDLYLEITVDKHARFAYNNNDLHTRVEISAMDVIIGGETEIIGLDGRKFVLIIPPATQPNAKMRIPGQGLYKDNTTSKGDLYITIDVVVPKLSDSQIDSVKRLNESFK